MGRIQTYRMLRCWCVLSHGSRVRAAAATLTCPVFRLLLCVFSGILLCAPVIAEDVQHPTLAVGSPAGLLSARCRWPSSLS